MICETSVKYFPKEGGSFEPGLAGMSGRTFPS